MIRKHLIALGGWALVVGCTTPNPWADQIKVPNPWGTPFRDKQEVLQAIPAGTSVDKVQAAMRAHGFEPWSSQRQKDQVTLIFHRFLGDWRDPAQDTWVTILLRREAVVDVEIRSGPPGPSSPGTGRSPEADRSTSSAGPAQSQPQIGPGRNLAP